MKKTFLTFTIVFSFAAIANASTGDKAQLLKRTPCATAATNTCTAYEDTYGCLTSDQYNIMWYNAYNNCMGGLGV